ncbi:uncharacterized protein LOC126882971 [Diabrotica virgifera virgifera]|uniref:Uncharacterized protein n=1 Tax=Diabrotica virgifera virgifera TaxID=50390 RepID=A0ABM5K1J5_DIAVI|nr:uncharacterized protein LOC126882971 [Diabrotica virgifera virgifera]
MFVLEENFQMTDDENGGSRSTVVVYARGDVNLWIQAHATSTNTIIITSIDPDLNECIANHIQERDVKVECNNHTYTETYRYMNASSGKCPCDSSEIRKNITSAPPVPTTSPISNLPPAADTDLTTASTETSTPSSFLTTTASTKTSTPSSIFTTTASTETSTPNLISTIMPIEERSGHLAQILFIYNLMKPYMGKYIQTICTIEGTDKPYFSVQTALYKPFILQHIFQYYFDNYISPELQIFNPIDSTFSIPTPVLNALYQILSRYPNILWQLLNLWKPGMPTPPILDWLWKTYLLHNLRWNMFNPFLPLGLLKWTKFAPFYYNPLRNLIYNVYQKYNIYSRQISFPKFHNNIPLEWNIWNSLYPGLLNDYIKNHASKIYELYKLSDNLTIKPPNYIRKYLVPIEIMRLYQTMPRYYTNLINLIVMKYYNFIDYFKFIAYQYGNRYWQQNCVYPNKEMCSMRPDIMQLPQIVYDPTQTYEMFIPLLRKVANIYPSLSILISQMQMSSIAYNSQMNIHLYGNMFGKFNQNMYRYLYPINVTYSLQYPNVVISQLFGPSTGYNIYSNYLEQLVNSMYSSYSKGYDQIFKDLLYVPPPDKQKNKIIYTNPNLFNYLLSSMLSSYHMYYSFINMYMYYPNNKQIIINV